MRPNIFSPLSGTRLGVIQLITFIVVEEVLMNLIPIC